MGQYSAAVYSAPNKVGMRERISSVILPCDFGIHKIFYTTAFHYLRQRRCQSEHIRQPQHFAVDTKLVFDKFLAVGELANQTFARRNIHISLNPHSTLNNDFAVLYGCFYIGIQIGIFVFENIQKPRLSLNIFIIIIFPDKLHLITDSSCNFSSGFLFCPKPLQIKM